jgi:protein TonB
MNSATMEAKAGPGGNRRFWAMLGLSLAIHALALTWVQRPQRELPALTPLLATLRLVVEQTSEPAAEVQSAPPKAALPPAAKPLAPRREQRSVRSLAETAAPAVSSVQPAVEAMPAPTVAATPSFPSPAATQATPPAAEATSLPIRSQSSLLAAYRQSLTEIFAGQQQYPRVAALRGWEGEVRLRLRVARKGNLLAVQLDHSSGFDVLDQHALAMLQELTSLPPLPDGLEANEIQVVVPVNYKLKKTT